MTIILYCLCAVALVVTGAVVSGGLRLPRRRETTAESTAADDDQLTRDIRAMLTYGGEEETDEI